VNVQVDNPQTNQENQSEDKDSSPTKSHSATRQPQDEQVDPFKGGNEEQKHTPTHSNKSKDSARKSVNKERSGGMLVIKDPQNDCPPLEYTVDEEQPPYSTGHQELTNFTKLFIHNIDFHLKRDDILRAFNVYGRIKHINMPYDNRNRPRGLSFVTYVKHEDAKRALEVGMTGMVIGSRKLRVEVFKPLETLNQEKRDKTKPVRKSSKERDSSCRLDGERDKGKTSYGALSEDRDYPAVSDRD